MDGNSWSHGDSVADCAHNRLRFQQIAILNPSATSETDPATKGEAGAGNAVLRVTHLEEVMARSTGCPAVRIGLPDGPVDTSHPELAGARFLPGARQAATSPGPSGPAQKHGTFIAGVLVGRRGGSGAGICPDCTVVTFPLFNDGVEADNNPTPSATPAQLAEAIAICIDAGARVVNVSAGFSSPSVNEERAIEQVLTYAARRGVVVVAAAGNQGSMGSSSLTRHPAVIPVVASNTAGLPLAHSNLGASIGRRGLAAPADSITSLSPGAGTQTGSGTSVAAPFVTGALALLFSLFPEAAVQDVKRAVLGAARHRRHVPVPPLMDAEAAYQLLAAAGRS